MCWINELERVKIVFAWNCSGGNSDVSFYLEECVRLCVYFVRGLRDDGFRIRWIFSEYIFCVYFCARFRDVVECGIDIVLFEMLGDKFFLIIDFLYICLVVKGIYIVVWGF